ncbi:MAG: T9SS type A sorting domain-containing protein [Flavobacteriia bacterium]|jgi:hypothetical protein
MNKILLLSLFAISSLFASSQTPELIYSNNLSLQTATADSANYYYFDPYFSTINSLDVVGNKTELVTVPDVSASFQNVMVCNKGKCIFGNSTSSGTFYFLFNGTSIDTLYESNAQMTFDRIIEGDYVYYHDTKRIYYTDLSSVDNFQILHTAQNATDFSGISEFFEFDDKIFFKETDQINGGSSLKVLDMNTNVITDLTSNLESSNFNISKSPNSIVLIEEPYGSWAKIWEIGNDLSFELLYDGMLAGFDAPSISKYLGKLNNEIILQGSIGGTPCLLKNVGPSVTTLNLGTDQNTYPTMIQSYYQAGDYIYFMAADTNYLNYTMQQNALWVTDGTLEGTRKMIPFSSPNVPQYINMFETINKPNVNCHNDLWIGFNSDKLLHVNAESNFIESFTDAKNAKAFYPVLSNDFVIFASKNASNQIQIKKITCSGSLELIEEQFNDFSIFPNPTENEFKIDNANGFQDASIVVSDLTGKVILEEKLNGKEGIFSLNGFKSGVYIVKIKDKSTSVSKLLIKD